MLRSMTSSKLYFNSLLSCRSPAVLCDIPLLFYRPFPFGPLLIYIARFMPILKSTHFPPFLFCFCFQNACFNWSFGYLVIFPHFLTSFCDAAAASSPGSRWQNPFAPSMPEYLVFSSVTVQHSAVLPSPVSSPAGRMPFFFRLIKQSQHKPENRTVPGIIFAKSRFRTADFSCPARRRKVLANPHA